MKVLSDDDFKPEKLYTGEPARLNSLKTQRPPFDVKNPYMAPVKVRVCWRNISPLHSSNLGKTFDILCVINLFSLQFKVNRNLHRDDSDRRCMHIEIDISGSRIRYDAGDHVAIYPQNDTEGRTDRLLNAELH